MIKNIKGYMTTLVSGVMFGFVGIHTLEDIVLLSIGRFAPVHWAVMYAIGLLASWLVMGALLHKVIGHDRNEHHHNHPPHDIAPNSSHNDT